MLINFGDNRNGKGAEEPANQEGSLAAIANPSLEEAPAEQPSKAEPLEKSVTVSEPKKKLLQKR